MCATCGKPVPYRSRQRYCSRRCYLHRRIVCEWAASIRSPVLLAIGADGLVGAVGGLVAMVIYWEWRRVWHGKE